MPSGNYRTAAARPGRDADRAATVGALRERPYPPVAGLGTSLLEEWMSPDDLGATAHHHLSPLGGLFPGDRTRPDAAAPADIATRTTALPAARGMDGLGRAGARHPQRRARPENARQGTPIEVRVLGGGGTMTCVGHAGRSRTVRRRGGGSVTLRDVAR
ncbi:hypothetical protein BFF78_39215 [Streptomyces fodineus]|uniref:Glycosyl hydrolase family 95 catalytic domain-containing protein n=1 Tax=Streptomyces fodineus TaxID=1904616 RepID=A0A1D7YLN5_9ACTN|nr:hypothetical protein [Streptomyces fodineus]AOR36289.1 hypothetical protein BFF78_39215 [Streptomyces fodineus]